MNRVASGFALAVLGAGLFVFVHAFTEWFIAISVAALLVGSTLEYYRRRGVDLRADRRRRGLCTRCGYDLRATPERCPECGATSSS